MKLLVLLFSTIIAIVSVLSYKISILETVKTLLNQTAYTIITGFEGLALIPPISIYGSPKPANMSVPRTIRKAFLAIEQSEGVGAKVRRSIGTPQLRNFSPFLMLDHFNIKPGAGFPDHPHRGQASPPFTNFLLSILTVNTGNHHVLTPRCSGS